MCREPLRVKDRRVLPEPQRLIRQPVHADDHRGRHAGRLEGPAPPRDPLAVAGEHDRPGGSGRGTSPRAGRHRERHRDARYAVAGRHADVRQCSDPGRRVRRRRPGGSRVGRGPRGAGVPSTMIVGVHGLADETLRLGEYSPVFDAERFAGHMRGSSPGMPAGGRGRGSRFGVARPPGAPRYSASRRAGRLALALGCGIRMSTARFSPARRAAELPAGWRAAGPDSAHVPRGRPAGAVLPRQRGPVGGRVARCGPRMS